MKEGNFGAGFKELTKARAIDLAMKKGFKTGFDDMTVQSSTGVLVEIVINGQHVPVGPDDYTPDEIKAMDPICIHGDLKNITAHIRLRR